MADLILLAVLAQPVSPAMTFYDFVLALLDRPVIVLLLTALAGLITWWARRLEQAVTATRRELGQVHAKVDGQGDELRKVTARAAFAEGELKGAVETAPQIIESVKPLVAPPARTGLERTRATDAVPPTSAPPDVDQRSQL